MIHLQKLVKVLLIFRDFQDSSIDKGYHVNIHKNHTFNIKGFLGEKAASKNNTTACQ